MAVLHDFMCKKHGVFESRESAPACPMKGCEEETYKVFLKPVGLRSARTKAGDRAAETLALDFNMTDIKTTREGEHQTGYHTRNNSKGSEREFQEAAQAVAQRQGVHQRPGSSVLWGGGGRFNMAGALAGGFARPVKDEAVGAAVPKLAPPRPGSGSLKDPENLKIPT